MAPQAKLYVFGVTGRMGQEISSLLNDNPAATLVGGTSTKGSTGDMAAADVFIDFSVSAATKTILDLAQSLEKPLVIGTTGLTQEQLELVKKTAQSVPILQASNMSLGIAVMAKLAETAARILDLSYDIEIVESHHRNKVDAPSGTALSLGQVVAKGRGNSLEALMADVDRSGQRVEGKIGFSVQRGGGVIGEHAIRFMGDDEVIGVSHQGLSRQLFARGAIKAALWLRNQSAGLYTMQDVLGVG